MTEARALRPVLVVNAGGESRRMGQPKALLGVPPDGTPLLAHIVQRLTPVVDQERVVVITNNAELEQSVRLPLPGRYLPDAYPDTGTLGGIATGLGAVEGWALVLACDLPLVSAPLCAWLANLAGERTRDGDDTWDVVMPVVGGYEEPLHALYHRRCLPFIEARLARGERRVISFLPDVRVRYVQEPDLRAVDPELRSFVNANTPDEWQRALALLQQDG
jgi:molybdopterin-guanine dinucleotide biosynthesis protein A